MRDVCKTHSLDVLALDARTHGHGFNALTPGFVDARVKPEQDKEGEVCDLCKRLATLGCHRSVPMGCQPSLA